jgi:hypothetical protein
VIARLRAAPEDSPPKNRRPANTPVLQPPAPSRAKENAQRPALKFSLQEDAFLKFAGLSLDSPKPKLTHAQNVPVNAPIQSLKQPFDQTIKHENVKLEPVSVTSKDIVPVVPDPVNFRQPSIKKEPEQHTSIFTAPSKAETIETTAVQPQLFLKKEVGLSASKWANPAQDTQPSALESATVLSNANDVYPRKNIIREHGVIFRKDNGVSSQGYARLIKSFKDDKFLTLELEPHIGNTICEVLNNDATLTLDESRIIFKAADQGVPCSTWTITFQVPYQALAFKATVDKNNQGHPTVKPSTQQGSLPSRPLSQASSIPQEFDNAVDATSFSPEPSVTIKSEPVFTQSDAFHSYEEARIDHDSNFNRAELTRLDLDQLSVHPSEGEEPVLTACVNEPTSEQDLFGFSTQSPHVRNRISTQALDEMAQVAGVTRLISFDTEEEVPVMKRETAVHHLLGLDDELLLQSTYEYLNNTPIGTILNQLSVTVVRKGGSSAEGLSGPQLLASELYISAIYDLVGGFLSRSEIFASMPDYVSIPYMEDKSRKILEMAVAARDGPALVAAVTSAEATETPESISNESRSCVYAPQHPHVQLEPASNNWDIALGNALAKKSEVQEQKDNNVGMKINRPSRITYTFKELMDIRKNAVEFSRHDLDEEVAHLARPSLANSSTVPQTVNTTVNVPRSAAKTLQAYEAKNTQTQLTDMGQWLAMLSPEKKSAAAKVEPLLVPDNIQSQTETAIHVLISKNQEIPVMVQSSKHFPRNSDYERLAKSLEGFHLEPELAEKANTSQPTAPIAVKTESSTQVTRGTPKSRLMEDAIVAKLISPNLLSAQSPDVSLSRSPLAVVHTRLQAIGAHLDPTKKAKIEVAPALPAATPKPLTPSLVANIALPSTVDKKPIFTPTVIDMPQTELVNTQTISDPRGRTTITSANVGNGEAKACTTLPTLHSNPVLPSNKDLKGMPGLAASKWSTAQTSPNPKVRAFQPASSYMYDQGPGPSTSIPNSVASPPPILPNMPNVAPVFQTVLVKDEFGQYREVTGMVKAGSIPVVAHMPVPPVTQENIGFNHTHTTHFSMSASFPARLNMLRHLSNESDESDQAFKPLPPNFYPSRDRSEVAPVNPVARPPLSPVRQGDNIQAKLQSRLNNSLAARVSPQK